MRTRSIVLSCISFVLPPVLAACTVVPVATVTEKVDVPATVERSADVKLTMDSGDIRLAGGAAELVEGTMTYLQSDGKPRTVSGSRDSTAGKIATVEIGQGTVSPGTFGRRLMDLRLNGGLPTDVTVTERSGDADLDLRLVDVKDIGVDSASGNVSVQLAGPHPSLSHASFVSKSGETSIAANGEYPALEGFGVQSASGNVTLDLSGTWKKSFIATVEAASGDVTLVLPTDINLRVVGRPKSGQVRMPAANPDGSGTFTQHGDTWTAKPAKPSEFTLTVEVALASGDLRLAFPPKK